MLNCPCTQPRQLRRELGAAIGAPNPRPYILQDTQEEAKVKREAAERLKDEPKVEDTSPLNANAWRASTQLERTPTADVEAQRAATVSEPIIERIERSQPVAAERPQREPSPRPPAAPSRAYTLAQQVRSLYDGFL